jgi:hypothetical protein
LADQTAEYNGFKAARDTLKTELAGLYSADDAGNLDNAGIDRLIELEGLLDEAQHIYDDAKTALDQRQEAANEKTYARTQAELAKANAVLTEATANTTVAKTAYDALVKEVTAAEAEKARI